MRKQTLWERITNNVLSKVEVLVFGMMLLGLGIVIGANW